MQGVFRIGENIGDLNGFALQQDSRDHTAASWRKRLGLHEFIVLRRMTVARCVVIRAGSLLAHDRSLIRLTQPCRRLDQRVEYGLQVEGGSADDLEHLGRRRLLLQRFAQLVEQPSVLDRDSGLVGKGHHQLNLPGCECPHRVSCQSDNAYWRSLPQHWNAKHGTKPTSVAELVRIVVFWISQNVGDVNNSSFEQNASRNRASVNSRRMSCDEFGKLG